jgi:hypothetical protein
MPDRKTSPEPNTPQAKSPTKSTSTSLGLVRSFSGKMVVPELVEHEKKTRAIMAGGQARLKRRVF